MKFKCRPGEMSFLETAPIQLAYSVKVNSALEDVFDVLQNPHTWPEWFPGMTKASDIINEGFERSRIVTLNHVLNFKEEFILWEPPFRLAYRVAAVSIPYAEELVEEFSIKELQQGVEIRYRIGMEVHHSLKLMSAVVEKIGASSYEKALTNLKAYLGSLDA